MRFQNKENSITAPKVAPNPAHAKETIRNTELSGFLARKTPITAITITVSLAMSMEDFFDSFSPMQSQKRFCETHEDAAKSWESDVDMVLARIPARIRPAIITVKTP